MSTRRLRTFKRWMSEKSITYTSSLHLHDTKVASGISISTTQDLEQGQTILTIPKQACLTIPTSGVRDMIQSCHLEGSLGLSVAIMYERSLGVNSTWFGYLQVLDHFEDLPFLWCLNHLDRFLSGTELHKIVKEDKALIYEDWKECILPLIQSDEFGLDPKFFGVEDYFAAKSLVASRSFQIDDYHGFGMVPLADLFNHKTGAEDVHFTCTPSDDESDDNEENVTHEIDTNDKIQTQTSLCEENGSLGTSIIPSSSDSTDSEFEDTPDLKPEDVSDNSLVLEMILVKDVKAGSEIFNTYGSMGNAALLHRYGFTELDNPYDIVNIDLELVLQWSSSLFSSRHSRTRLSLWRKLGYSGCESQNSEYFEISFAGEPQIELLLLLHILLLSQETYTKLDLTLASNGKPTESLFSNISKKGKILQGEISDMSSDMLLTNSVCKALMALADIRELLYGTSSLEDDLESLKKCDCTLERKLYHSLVLRVSERRILQKLRNYAQVGCKKAPRLHSRKKMKL